ncbi:FAD-binding protein [Escherichia coli]
MESGEVVYFKAKATVLATGGAGGIYQSTTNAHINTGDGVGMALRAGVGVQDMELSPTGIAGAGVLVTEGCRGEGGYLLIKMANASWSVMPPMPRTWLVSRRGGSLHHDEIREGASSTVPWGPRIKLKLDHLGKEVLESRLPGILRTFSHLRPRGPGQRAHSRSSRLATT